jgi:hypothetical protein
MHEPLPWYEAPTSVHNVEIKPNAATDSAIISATTQAAFSPILDGMGRIATMIGPGRPARTRIPADILVRRGEGASSAPDR